MIAITADEKKAIHEMFPDVHIARTMKNDSKRHHYYMTEDRRAMRLLDKIRGIQEPVRKERGRNRRKKA